MSKRTKGWLTAAVVWILSGCALFAGVMVVIDMDFKKLSTVSYEDHTYTVTEPYSRIDVSTHTADVIFVASDNDETTISCHEQQNLTYCVDAQDGTLIIQVIDTREWNEHITIFAFDTPTVVISLPRTFNGGVSLNGFTGDVTIPDDFTFDSLDVTISTGDITVGATTTWHMTLATTTGDIVFEGADAVSIRATASTGDIKGRLLSGKIFAAKTSTGDVDVPPNSHGGLCELSTSTGNIRITVAPD